MGYAFDSGVSVASVRTKTYTLTPMVDDELTNDTIFTDTLEHDYIDDAVYDDNHVDEQKPDSIFGGDVDKTHILDEGYSYDPKDIGSVAHVDNDKTIGRRISLDHDAMDPIIDIHRKKFSIGSMDEILSIDKDSINEELLVDFLWLNEAALTARQRKSLHDTDFGLPRLRKYPLHDRKHVLQAIRLFHHVDNDADRKTLATNIIRQVEELKIAAKVGQNNPLYDYVPDKMKSKPLNEANNKLFNAATVEVKGAPFVPVYVLLTANPTRTAGIIRAATREPYSHASISFDHQLRKVYSFDGRGMVKESVKSGDLSKLSKMGSKYALYVTFVTKDVADRMKATIKEFIDNAARSAYNKIGMVACFFRIPTMNAAKKYKQFCSEFVANILNISGIDIGRVASTVQPMDLVKIEKFAFMSSGDLIKYNPDETLDKLKAIIKDRKIKKYLVENSIFFNNVFYNKDFAKHFVVAKDYTVLEVFYPCVKWGLINQIRSSIGGLSEVKDLIEDRTIEFDNLRPIVDGSYNKDYNRYKAVTKDKDGEIDLAHVMYCARLYEIVRSIRSGKIKTLEDIPSDRQMVLADWKTSVKYHHARHQECKVGSEEQLMEKQYLHDLLWDWRDNPTDETIISNNIIGFCRELNMVESLNEGYDGLVDPEDMYAFLSKSIIEDEGMYLLPGEMKYPILDKQSVHMAMGMVPYVEPENIEEFTTNLNAAYDNFLCNFKIPYDHPYAKYAKNYMVDSVSTINEHGFTDSPPAKVSTNVGNTHKSYSELEFYGFAQNLLDGAQDAGLEKLGKKVVDAFSKLWDTDI